MGVIYFIHTKMTSSYLNHLSDIAPRESFLIVYAFLFFALRVLSVQSVRWVFLFILSTSGQPPVCEYNRKIRWTRLTQTV